MMMRGTLRLVALFVVVFGLVVGMGCGPEAVTVEAEAEATAPVPSPAVLLFVIDGGDPALGPPEDPNAPAAPYELLLEMAVLKTTTEEKMEIADCVATGVQMLAEEGIEVSCLDFLAGTVAAAPEEPAGPWSYEEVAAVLVASMAGAAGR